MTGSFKYEKYEKTLEIKREVKLPKILNEIKYYDNENSAPVLKFAYFPIPALQLSVVAEFSQEIARRSIDKMGGVC